MAHPRHSSARCLRNVTEMSSLHLFTLTTMFGETMLYRDMSPEDGSAIKEGPLPIPSPATLDSVGVHDNDNGVDDNDNGEAPFDLACVRHGLKEEQGPRSSMQDASLVIDDLAAAVTGHNTQDWPEVTALYAVFDGHGDGLEDRGRHASQFTKNCIVRCLAASDSFPSDMGAALRDAILSRDVEYWDAYKSSPQSTGGTTALVAVVWGNTLYVANTGDCRAVLSQQGKAIVLTRDHRPDDPEEKRRIHKARGSVIYDDYEDGGRVGGRYAVSRVIGDFGSARFKQDPTKGPWPLTAEPEITVHKLGHHDEFMIMGSDGFWDWQGPGIGCKDSQSPIDSARTWLQEHNDPQQCAQQLMAKTLAKTGDNVTIAVVCFGKDPPENISGTPECAA